jgi:dTDP-4-dehydrorhamnose 3,5-epimerase
LRFVNTDLPGVVIVEPEVFGDDRGLFFEVFHADKYAAAGLPSRFVQDNHSYSERGVVRGLHGQMGSPQGKLVRVVRGEIFDVAVDVRRGSPAFGRWIGVVLSADNRAQLFIPPDFLHGFCVTGEGAEVEYKCTAVYDPKSEFGVRWDDPEIGIDWPVKDPVVSPRDAAAPRLSEVQDDLPEYVGDEPFPH